MASATRKTSPSKRDRKLGARHPDGGAARGQSASALKNSATGVAKNGRDDTTASENRPARVKGFSGGKDAAAGIADGAAESRVPPALPVPIASFTF